VGDAARPHRRGVSAHDPRGQAVSGDPRREPACGRAGLRAGPQGRGPAAHQRTPHVSFENTTDVVRWSMDLRYQSAALPTNAVITPPPGRGDRLARGAVPRPATLPRPTSWSAAAPAPRGGHRSRRVPPHPPDPRRPARDRPLEVLKGARGPSPARPDGKMQLCVILEIPRRRRSRSRCGLSFASYLEQGARNDMSQPERSNVPSSSERPWRRFPPPDADGDLDLVYSSGNLFQAGSAPLPGGIARWTVRAP
jgi:hypothetical protein